MPDQWELASKKLFELTEAGKIKWRRFYSYRPAGIVPNVVYLAEVSNKQVVVYEERTQGENEFGVMDEYLRPVIEFATPDFDGTSLLPEWRWPGSHYHYKVLESVRYHTAAGQEFLESFLSSAS